MCAVMRLTWRFLPSLILISNQVVGMALRSRMGGVLGHNNVGVSMMRTAAAWVTKSDSATPNLNGAKSSSLG